MKWNEIIYSKKYYIVTKISVTLVLQRTGDLEELKIIMRYIIEWCLE